MSQRNKNGRIRRCSESNDSDDSTSTEHLETKLMQAIENASGKSVPKRVEGLQSICDTLVLHYMPDFLDDCKETLEKLILRSICLGKELEKMVAVSLAPQLMLQMGGGTAIFKTLNPHLLAIVQNANASFEIRIKCCSALGLLNFLSGGDTLDLVALMQSFEDIFGGSYSCADEMSVVAEESTLRIDALCAWGLLLTSLPAGDLVSITTGDIPTLASPKKFMGLFESPHMGMRIAAGETLALILERGRLHCEQFWTDHLGDLINTVKRMNKEIHKYQTKKDRKSQRGSFRDVLRYLEEGIIPEIHVSFGKETLVLDTWGARRRYSVISGVIGPGMDLQLKKNEYLRDLFQLNTYDVNKTGNSNSKEKNKNKPNASNKKRFAARGTDI